MNIFELPRKLNLTNKTLLITGGTGSFGSYLTRTVLQEFPDIAKIIIFSRDEYKQLELANLIPENDLNKVQFVLGDIRDKEAVETVFKNTIDYVFHAAALKHISFSESNPTEFIKTNIHGSKNIFDASNKFGVKKCIVISSDKAAAASNTYGRTKAEMEKLMYIAQNNGSCQFSAIRFGNFWASRGSVVPQFFVQFTKKGNVQLFSEISSRFFITLKDAVHFSLLMLQKTTGGEIFIPKLPSIYIKYIAKAIAGDNIELVKNRKGEKTHENLLAEPEISQTLENESYYILTNNDHDFNQFKETHNASAITSFSLLKSDTNTYKITLNEVKNMVAEYKQNQLVQTDFNISNLPLSNNL